MTTILFSTSHDTPTAANTAVATQVVNGADVSLFGAEATRAALLAAIVDSPGAPVILMAHGSPTAVFENDTDEAFGAEDCGLIVGRVLFAWACNTAKNLGREAAAAGAVWMGYDCPITAPEENEPFLQPFVMLFSRLKAQFRHVGCLGTAGDFLEDVRQKCAEVEDILDRLLSEYDGDAFGPLCCCRQAWQQLRIWIPGHELPVSHPESVAPYIDI